MKITTENLSKTYPGNRPALKDVSLEFGTGLFGVLGPNGSGKTTLLRILATLLAPTGGCARVDGFDVTDAHHKWTIRQVLGYTPQEAGLYPRLTPAEFLDYIATLKNIHTGPARREAVEQALWQAGLGDAVHQPIRTLSSGMKRRVAVAQALLGKPQLLIVDEPTSGLDPEERARLRSLLARLAADRTVLLSTHIVEDVASCTAIAVLLRGEVAFKGSPEALTAAARGSVWELEIEASAASDPVWRVSSSAPQDTGGGLRLRIVGARPSIYARQVDPTLEEAYLYISRK